MSLISFYACNNADREEWEKCKEVNTFEDYFLFAQNHQTSVLFDSAIYTLNKFLLQRNHFYVKYIEDSNTYVRGEITNFEISKSDVFALSYKGKYAYYRDTIYLNDSILTLKMEDFLNRKISHNNIWLFCDTIRSTIQWKSLFKKIDNLNLVIRKIKDEYAYSKWNIEYEKLNEENKVAMKKEIRINLFIFFYNPVLIPDDIKLPIIE